MTGLPERWTRTNLNELFEFKYGKGLVQEKRNPAGSVNVYGSNGIVGKHDEALTHGTTIIVGRKGSVGEVNYSADKCWAIDTTYYVDDFACQLPPNYWAWYFKSLRLGQQEKSSAIPGISRDDIYSIDVPLPPINEQRRIVAKLEEVLSRADAAQARLATIPLILKRFRQSVLAAACSGQLTADWRDNVGRSLEPRWKSMPARDACDVVQSGSTPSKDRFKSDVGIPYLKIYNIVNQRIDFLTKKQYIDVGTHKNLKRSIVKPGDVLMNIVGPPLGKVALVPSTHAEWNINQAIVLFRPKPFLSSHFLYYLLCSGLPYSEILNETRGSAGQSNISLSQCRDMFLVLPEIDEQQEIVRRAEALFKTADALEARYRAAKAHVAKLTQSILAKAFRGELVPQDPNDEPASILLERIRTERNGNERKTGGRRK